MNATLTNGRARKSLADQIDRLDNMLDGLADGLNEAVATAATSSMQDIVSLAVRQAVRTTLTEILSSPEVLKRLAPQAAPAPSGIAAVARAGWSALVGFAKRAWTAVVGSVVPAAQKAKESASDLLTAATEAVRKRCERIAAVARNGWMLTTVLAAMAKQYRIKLAVALAIGAVVGIVCWLGGREVASVGCGLSGIAGSIATAASARLRRSVNYLANFQS